MPTKASLIERIYHGIKQDLSSGALLPGQRVDVAALCERFGASKSPIRNVLNRLVGEDLLEVHAHDGFYRPRVTEQKLRDLYQWTETILLLSLEKAFPEGTTEIALPPVELAGEDVVIQTEQLFSAVASLGGNVEFRRAIYSTNDRLRPIRRQKDTNLIDRPSEVAALASAWQAADIPALRKHISTYHRVRLDLIPRIVAFAYRDPTELIDQGFAGN